MNAYSRALGAYLKNGRTQEALAAEIGCTQPTVHRYVEGRFPSADIARKIHQATEGAVPFETWQEVAIEKYGIGQAA